jgi:hypothetical protein
VNKKLEQQFDEELCVEDILNVCKSSPSSRRPKPEAPKKFSKPKEQSDSFAFQNELEGLSPPEPAPEGLYADLGPEDNIFYYSDGPNDEHQEQLTEEELEELAIDQELNFQDLPVEELMARLPAYMFLEEGQRDEYFRQLNETYFNHSSSKKPTPVSKEEVNKKVVFMKKNKVKSKMR